MASHNNFKLTKRPVIEDNPELLAIPEFARLTERQIRYVFLMEWHKSPLRLMSVEDRKKKAVIMAGYKMEKEGDRLDMNARNVVNGTVQNIEYARKLLKEIQHDEEAEMFSAIDFHLNEILEFLKKPDKTDAQLEKASKLAKELPSVVKTRRELEETLNYRTTDPDEISVEDTTELAQSDSKSFLEDFLNNEQ